MRYDRLMMHNWQRADWPKFAYDPGVVEEALARFVEHAGRVGGLLEGLSEPVRTETVIDLMVAEAVKSSAIEGEAVKRDDVRSSIRARLGLALRPERIRDRRARGIAELMVAVREGFAKPLDHATLFSWHAMVMAGSAGVRIGRYRTHAEPMRVVSGSDHKPRIHFEAPPSARVPAEMDRFIERFNTVVRPAGDGLRLAPVHAAIAHLHFESIHPFEDGNGRIGRALAEMALARCLGRPPVLSLSQKFAEKRAAYYRELERAQKSDDATAWVSWFVNATLDAQRDAEELVRFTLLKARFLERFTGLESRRMKAIRRMLAEGPRGFAGGMSAGKYAALTGVSKATATRDLKDLADLGALRRVGGGRSTRYELTLK